jgi:hypothetical protein
VVVIPITKDIKIVHLVVLDDLQKSETMHGTDTKGHLVVLDDLQKSETMHGTDTKGYV